MIVSFRDQGTRDVFHGVRSKRGLRVCPPALWALAQRKMDHLNQGQRLDDLLRPPGNRLEALRGDRWGQHSIRINGQYRICFVWTLKGPARVEIVDYH